MEGEPRRRAPEFEKEPGPEKKREREPIASDEYWFCVMGPVSRKKIPRGGDFSMREMVRNMFKLLTGEDPKHLFSAWGTEEVKEKIISAAIEG